MVKQSLTETELKYFTTIIQFLYAKNHKEAIAGLSASIRGLYELPISTEVEKSTSSDVKWDQSKIKTILEGLHEGKRLHDISEIHDFNFCYYAFFTSVADVEEDSLYADTPHFPYETPIPHTAILAFCLVGLLRSGTDRIRKHIYKCELCKKYFVSKKIDPAKIKYCPGYCRESNKMETEERSAYDKRRRSILKKRKEVQEHKKRINEYMERTGCTLKDAEEYVQADKEISTDKTSDNGQIT